MLCLGLSPSLPLAQPQAAIVPSHHGRSCSSLKVSHSRQGIFSFSPACLRIFTELHKYVEPTHRSSEWSRTSKLSVVGLLPSPTAHTSVHIAVELDPFLTFRTPTGCSEEEAKPDCFCVTGGRTERGYRITLVLYLRPASGCYGNRNSSHQRGLLRTPPRRPLSSHQPPAQHLGRRGGEKRNSSFHVPKK